MFLFGHLGIGSKIVSPVSKGLPRKAILWGTILPDLIDKPLYYGLVFFTGKKGVELAVVHGTRSFGHTAIFTLSLAVLAIAGKSKTLAGLSLGTASHLLLDNITDYFVNGPHLINGALVAMLWPWMGNFPVLPARTLTQHLLTIRTPFLIGAEVLGAILLFTRPRSDS